MLILFRIVENAIKLIKIDNIENKIIIKYSYVWNNTIFNSNYKNYLSLLIQTGILLLIQFFIEYLTILV